jgi:hypothetical protein
MGALLIGCGEVPQQAIDEAKAELDAAKSAEADRYVPDMYNAANKSYQDAMAIVEKEKEAMFSNYDEALPLLQTAKEGATNAKNAVEGAKTEVKTEVEGMLAQIPEEIKTARQLWKKAPRGKGTREALAMMKQEIDDAEASIEKVNATVESGDYLAARQQAQQLMSKVKQLQGELQK